MHFKTACYILFIKSTDRFRYGFNLPDSYSSSMYGVNGKPGRALQPFFPLRTKLYSFPSLSSSTTH